MKSKPILIGLGINFVFFFSQQLLAEVVYEQQPMYGKRNNSNANLFIDENQGLLSKAITTFGTREHASEGYTEKGFDHYSNNEFNKSMKRFNQAWLLNPENPYPYLGFALLININKQSCEAYQMFKIANEKGVNENGFLADYAYTTSQCAVTKDNSEKESLFKHANELHEQATQTPNQRLLAYVYHSWAKSYFLQENLDKTKEMIEASKSFGGKIDASLLDEIKKHSEQ
jgi:hypothetical protein